MSHVIKKITFPIYISDQKFENSIDLLHIFHGEKSHYVYIKDFDRFMFHKTKSKNQKYFENAYSVLVAKIF